MTSFNKNALKGAAERAGKLLTERDRIKSAIARTNHDLLGAEDEATIALSSLGALEADNALIPDQQPADTRAARKKLASAREALEAVRARLDGLLAKLASNRAELIEAQGAFTTARSEADAVRLDEIQKKLMAVVSELRAAMAEAYAIDFGSATGGRIHLWLQNAFFASPDNIGLNLLDPTTWTSERGAALAFVDDARLRAITLPEHAALAERLERELRAEPETLIPQGRNDAPRAILRTYSDIEGKTA